MVEVTVSRSDWIEILVERGFDIDNVKEGVVRIYADSGEITELESIGLAPVPVDDTEPRKAPSGYHTHASLGAELETLAVSYASICRVVSLGTSVLGREIWAVLITDNPEAEEDEPEFKYVSTIHGNEPLGTELCLLFIRRLLEGYGNDERITHLVDETAVWVVPLMNPDGYESGSRYNADGYDLNRSFPVFGEDFEGSVFTGALVFPSETPVEVQRVAEWTADNSFVLSANFHAGALVVNYPYDDDGEPSGWDTPTPDDLLFEEVSMRYSEHNLPMWNSSVFENGITNGTAWYRLVGGMQDWNYRYAACNEVTIELSEQEAPPISSLPSFWANNEESMLSYAEAVHMGVRGLVTDSETGSPLWAEVVVEGNAHKVYTDPDVGDYHRMLLPGVYTLRITSAGYVPVTAVGVVVSDGEAARLDAAMKVLKDADVNADGEVNVVDVQLVVRAVLGLPTPYNCDIDGGGVSATDVQLVLNKVLGIEP